MGGEWAIVAVSRGTHISAIVLDASPAIWGDLHHAGINADDIWNFTDTDVGKILLWEGSIVLCRNWEGVMDDVDYIGEFATLTPDEMALYLAEGGEAVARARGWEPEPDGGQAAGGE